MIAFWCKQEQNVHMITAGRKSYSCSIPMVLMICQNDLMQWQAYFIEPNAVQPKHNVHMNHGIPSRERPEKSFPANVAVWSKIIIWTNYLPPKAGYKI